MTDRFHASERTPLLPRTPTPSRRHKAYAPPVAPQPASSSWDAHGLARQPRLHELGWLEYHLPDGSVYYVHPARRVTTDVNLRSERYLDAVEAWLDDRRDESLDVGVEAWLREAKGGAAKKGGWSAGKKGAPEVRLERFWVDHHARTVVKDTEEERRTPPPMRGQIRGNGRHSKGKRAASDPVLPQEERTCIVIIIHVTWMLTEMA